MDQYLLPGVNPFVFIGEITAKKRFISFNLSNHLKNFQLIAKSGFFSTSRTHPSSLAEWDMPGLRLILSSSF